MELRGKRGIAMTGGRNGNMKREPRYRINLNDAIIVTWVGLKVEFGRGTKCA